jgi:hypothetical protein
MTSIKNGIPFVPTRSTTGDIPAQSQGEAHKSADGNSFLNVAQTTLSSNYINSLLDYANKGNGGTAQPPVMRGSVAEPDPTQSGAQPGEGLKASDNGFPKGSVTTAGGWTVVPKGNSEWDIFAPGQKPDEKPMSKIWGDPHVEGQNKHDFDFSKSSDFLLPDGTRIYCKNTAESGHSLSDQLDIVNGADHVSITGLTTGSPTTSEVKPDGFGWREDHTSDHNRETFKLGGTVANAAWFKSVDGIDKGQVSGADFKDGNYVQTQDNTKQYWVDPSLKPPLGSKAYGEQMQNWFGDFIGSLNLSPEMKAQLSNSVYGGGVANPGTFDSALKYTSAQPGEISLGANPGGSTSTTAPAATTTPAASTTPAVTTAPTDGGMFSPQALGGLLGWNVKPGDPLGLDQVWNNIQGLANTAGDFNDMMAGVSSNRFKIF